MNQDLTAQQNALAACRQGDTLVVTKLDRLTRSVPDARDIVDELAVDDRRVCSRLGLKSHPRSNGRRP